MLHIYADHDVISILPSNILLFFFEIFFRNTDTVKKNFIHHCRQMDYKLLILKFILIFSDKTRHHSGNILPVPPVSRNQPGCGHHCRGRNGKRIIICNICGWRLMLRLYFGMTHMHIKKEPEEPPLLRPFRPPVQNLSPETLRFPSATSRVTDLPSLQTPGNGTSGEAM